MRTHESNDATAGATAPRRVLRGIAFAALFFFLGGLAWWAASVTLFSSTPSNAQEAAPITATVTQMTVGRALTLNVNVRQPFKVVGYNDAMGKITSISNQSVVNAGDVLYAVNTRPVVAVSGIVPFYRPLGLNAVGPDVDQLRAMLLSKKLLKASPTGRFDAAVASAVRRWQASIGESPTGVVELGDVIALPVLPTTIRLAAGVVVGARLGGGEPAILARSGEIAFEMVLNPAQAALIPAAASITVKSGGNSWPASITTRSADGNGNVVLKLAARDGSAVCTSECGSLPADEQLSLTAEVTIVAPATGPAVPVAAIHETKDQRLYVVRKGGAKKAFVKVIQSDGGFAVVDGVEVGAIVEVFSSGQGSTVVPSPPEKPAK